MNPGHFLRITLALCALACATAIAGPEDGGSIKAPLVDPLAPAEMADDVRQLMVTLQAVHPDLYFRVTPAEADQREHALLAQCTHPLERGQFDELVAEFVDCFGDDHTAAYPSKPRHGQVDASTPAPFWHFAMVAPDCGYLDLHVMRERTKWQAFLRETFHTLEAKAVPALIIDLRNDVGGDSRLGDDLLSYLTDQPYRSVARKCWRFSATYLPQIPNADPWSLSMADPATPPPPEYRRLFEQNPTPEFKAWVRSHAPERELAILRKYAPHWLGLVSSPAPATETLCLEMSLHAPDTPPLPRYRGRVCFLISHRTFSSGVILANTVEDFHLAPLLGEETKMCNQFGEPFDYRLPHSRLRINIATAQYVRANGDAADPHGVMPTIAVPAEPVGGKDLALDAALHWVRTPRGGAN